MIQLLIHSDSGDDGLFRTTDKIRLNDSVCEDRSEGASAFVH